jgi:glycosyltransferase involved in cell wall biosynthesis
MKSSAPQITVLMPAYNAAAYIAEAIQSVIDQTFTNFELLIVNDGSTDKTLQIINDFKDERMRVISQPNAGVSGALNAGLKHAKAAYIARFDADDVCYPQRLKKQFNFLQTNPDYVMVGSDADYILDNGDLLYRFHCIGSTHHQIMDKLYFYCPFLHPTVMYRKDVICNAGGYPLLAHNFEDYLLWTKVAGLGKFYNIPEPLIKYRLNASSVTIDERWRGGRFRRLKRDAIMRGSVTKEAADELIGIINKQNTVKVKYGAYHALCAKKFLSDNFQPLKARLHIKKAINFHPLRLDNYLLYSVSFLPLRFILWLHRLSPNKL